MPLTSPYPQPNPTGNNNPMPLPSAGGSFTPAPITNVVPGTTNAHGGVAGVNPLSPEFTTSFYQWLNSAMGQGAKPFDMSSFLPSTGGVTNPGQLVPALSPLLQQLQGFFTNGQPTGIPGLDTLMRFSNTGGPASGPGVNNLTQIAENGIPTNVGPEWQAMVASMRRGEDESRANLREQFASQGSLASSPYGRAATDFETQTNLGHEALLAQLQANASEAAAGRRVGASGVLAGLDDASKQRQMQVATTLMQGAAQLSTALQNLDQASVQATIAEFLRTQPEYGPLLNMMFGLATAFPPTAGKTGTSGVVGQLVANAPQIATAVSDIFKGNSKNGSGVPGATVTASGATPTFVP